MLLSNRFVHSDNGVLNDLSVNLNRYNAGSEVFEFIAAEDYIYIGSELPFNHRWFEFSVPNTQVGRKISIDLWDADEWVAAVDIVDQTEGFTKSGIISWMTDKDESWAQDDTVDANDNEEIIGLGDLKIFNLYWARIKFDGDLDATTSLKYVGHKFSDETDLAGVYPELATQNARDNFQKNKTDWKEQEFIAAQEIIRELKRSGVVVSGDQILSWEQFIMPSVHKVAEIIWRAYGDDFIDDRQRSHDDFKEAMDQEILHLDRNRNARVDSNERWRPVGRLHR